MITNSSLMSNITDLALVSGSNYYKLAIGVDGLAVVPISPGFGGPPYSLDFLPPLQFLQTSPHPWPKLSISFPVTAVISRFLLRVLEPSSLKVC